MKRRMARRAWTSAAGHSGASLAFVGNILATAPHASASVNGPHIGPMMN